MSDVIPDPMPGTAVAQPQPIGAPKVAPGWYSDPNMPGHQRWWTGREWSNHTSQAPSGTNVVVQSRKGVNHAFHLIMSLLTFGLWIPVWIIVTIAAA